MALSDGLLKCYATAVFADACLTVHRSRFFLSLLMTNVIFFAGQTHDYSICKRYRTTLPRVRWYQGKRINGNHAKLY